MTVTLRNYRGPEDIHLQNAFWVQVTRDLPWCWKPTISPLLYAKGAQFDPRSRCFAFDGDRLVGYMSFTGQGEFVSLGYPWVLPGYEASCKKNSMIRSMVLPPVRNMGAGCSRSVSGSCGPIRFLSSRDTDSLYSAGIPSMSWIFVQSRLPRFG